MRGETKIEKLLKEINYKMKQREMTFNQQMLRDEAWQSDECQEMYTNLIDYCGGIKVVRQGKRLQAKEHIITCYLKGSKIDFEGFKNGVKIANEKIARYKNRK